MIEGEELHSLGLGEVEGRVYEALLRERASTADELRSLLEVPAPRIAEALTSLEASGFTIEKQDGTPQPAAPAAAIRTLIHRRQAELHNQSAELEQLMMSADRIAGRLTASSPAASEGGIEIVTGPRQIGERAQSLLAGAEQEVVILDRPPYVMADEDHPERPPALDIETLLDRGVVVRAVIDREGLSYPGRMQSLAALAERGLRARVTSGVPTKLIGVDRRVTILPPTESGDPTASALVVGDTLLRNALLPLFESVWERSIPLSGTTEPPTETDPVPGQQRELLGLLAAGLKDEAIARRLGVHVHTARRRISRLLDALDAETRFQAGAQASARGWLA
ncbi:helix-turn-helix domain-containing protein [Streptomyces sp. NPDC051561]|uniref:helix-turn-helix domain-containing protein n=1 Tax=Streptomyces sp. NPDC051561 TaxID=3365658 RepID=UPI00379735A9